MNAGTLGEITVWLMDLVALGALAITGEVHPFVMGIILLFFVLSRIRVFSLGNPLLLLLLVLAIGGAAGSWLFLKMPLIAAVAQAAPVLHSALWLGGQRNRERVWRMAVGFVELNIVAVLTTDFYLAPLIFIFALLASIAISASFLESTARSYEKSEEPVRLPRAFLWRIIRISFLILLTSFIIFPILPRVHHSSEIDFGGKRTGYTEEVTLNGLQSPSGSGEGTPALSFFVPAGDSQGVQFVARFYLGLIRSRTLSVFDGVTWHPDRKALRRGSVPTAVVHREVAFEAIRQPLNTDALPVPYGTQEVRGIQATHLSSGEWISAEARDRRISYTIVLDDDRISPLGSSFTDLPSDVHLRVPEKLKTRGMQNLVRRLFTPGMALSEKVASLQRFFIVEKFAPFADSQTQPEKLEYSSRLQPLENFLFLAKKGHCELFSGSAAVLLRMAGIPTRLVAGFRVSRGPMGGVLTVRMGDAHAWLEYWVPEKGWKALDLTPRGVASGSTFDIFRRIYEAGSAFWYKNISSFDSEQQFNSGYRAIRSFQTETLNQWVAAHQSELIWAGIYFALFSFCTFLVIRTWFPWILSIRWKVNQGPAWIKHERVRMEQFLARKLYGRWFFDSREGLEFAVISRTLRERFGEPVMASFLDWEQAYLRARFGVAVETRAKMRLELRTYRKALKARFK